MTHAEKALFYMQARSTAWKDLDLPVRIHWSSLYNTNEAGATVLRCIYFWLQCSTCHAKLETDCQALRLDKRGKRRLRKNLFWIEQRGITRAFDPASKCAHLEEIKRSYLNLLHHSELETLTQMALLSAS